MNFNQFGVFEDTENIIGRETHANGDLNYNASVQFSDTLSCRNMLLSPTCINQFVMCDGSILAESVKSVASVDDLIEGPVNPIELSNIFQENSEQVKCNE